MDKQKQIRDKLIKVIKKQCICCNGNDCDKCWYDGDDCVEERLADAILDSNAIIPENAVVLTEERNKIICDRIKQLERIETELQELNAKYYNEAKDLRREIKRVRKETAEKFAEKIHNLFNRDIKDSVVYTQEEKDILKDFVDSIDEILKEITEV